MKRVILLLMPVWMLRCLIISVAALGLLLSMERQFVPTAIVQSGVSISRWAKILVDALNFVQIGF